MASADFTIDTNPVTSSVQVGAAASVALALVSTDGVTTIQWSVVSTEGDTLPTAYTIAAPSAPSTSLTSLTAGTAAMVQCQVNDGLRTVTKRGIFYVPTDGGFQPFVHNEELESGPSGWTGKLNELVNSQHAGQSPVAIATTTTLTTADLDRLTRLNPSGGVFNVTLPAAAGHLRLVILKNITASTNTVSLLTDGSDTIDLGPSSSMSTAFGSATLKSDGVSNWYVL